MASRHNDDDDDDKMHKNKSEQHDATDGRAAMQAVSKGAEKLSNDLDATPPVTS